ncbi:MAG TPA: T9SS type A sorting domain-containing protein, partial [Bacteroidia bacterium]|nr:T9SS type A sorting domain-containing protein [Bacteroidia bacterium]
IYLNHASMDVAVFGNFDVNGATFNADFQHGGWWYEYWSGDSLNVSNTSMSFTFSPGEYRLYTTVRLPKPDLSFVLGIGENGFDRNESLQIWPNPAADGVQIVYELPESGMTQIALHDLTGRILREAPVGFQSQGRHQWAFDLSDLPSGNYILRVQHASGTFSKPLVVRK